MKPVLSVVVPSYNVEQYLEKGLASFADARFNDRLEVIIVNDGSTDKTHEIASRFVSDYEKIFVLVDKENGGHGSAVNKGIEYATGKYFRIVDGDDWVNTENMARLLDYLEKSDTDLVIDNKREVHMVTGKTQYFGMPKLVQKEKTYAFEDVCLMPEVAPHIMIHTMSVKTSLLKENGIKLLEGIFYVDIEFIIKTTVYAKTIEFLDLEVYQYLIGNENQSVNYKNYVKRFSHHSKVTRELISFATEFKTSSKKLRTYLDKRVQLLINTHLNIALIFDEDRDRGLGRAKAFRNYLRNRNKKFYVITTPRYIVALALHYLGINYDSLQKLMRRK